VITRIRNWRRAHWNWLRIYLSIRLWLYEQLSRLRTEQGQGQTEFALIILVVVIVVVVALTLFGLVLYKYWDDLVASLPFS
jgi:hypothetical protein